MNRIRFQGTFSIAGGREDVNAAPSDAGIPLAVSGIVTRGRVPSMAREMLYSEDERSEPLVIGKRSTLGDDAASLKVRRRGPI
jgi:hypothetical protein